MRIELGNWNIEKAKDENHDDKVVSIRMIANKLEIDKDNQQILPQAFNKATVDSFIKNGIIDWHHGSVTGRTPRERALAIIGKPYRFQWEDGLPAVYGYLTKAHPVVRDAILPHLEAEQKVFGASIGGNIKKMRNVVDSVLKKATEQILAISWEHIAIAASPYVISAGSEVTLVKAYNSYNEIEEVPYIGFKDISEFTQEYNTRINKALTVSAQTDSAKLTGVDAMRIQGHRDYTEVLQSVLKAVRSNKVRDVFDLNSFLKAKGLNATEIEDFKQLLQKAMNNI